MRKARKIVLAEDSEADFQIMKTAFDDLNMGLELIHVNDGQELMNFLNEETLSKVAVVILDLDMPNIDGMQVLKNLYVDDELKKVPVVVFSAMNSHETILDCYGIGANAFVQKPTNAEEYGTTLSAIANFWADINVLPGFNSRD